MTRPAILYLSDGLLPQGGDGSGLLSSMEEGGGCGTSGDPSARQSCETLDKEDNLPLDHQVDQSQGEDLTLMWTGRPFGGLIADVKRKLPW